MDLLGNPLTTRPIQTVWEFTTEPYPSGQFGFNDHPYRQFGNISVWTRTRTRSDGLQPLLTLEVTPHQRDLRKVASHDWITQDYVINDVPGSLILEATCMVNSYEFTDVFRDESIFTFPIQ
jgi:hypothetical protein